MWGRGGGEGIVKLRMGVRSDWKRVSVSVSECTGNGMGVGVGVTALDGWMDVTRLGGGAWHIDLLRIKLTERIRGPQKVVCFVVYTLRSFDVALPLWAMAWNEKYQGSVM